MRTITPYAQYHINAMSVLQRASASTYNGSHSRRRIDSEHSIGMMKEWVIVRGRSDVLLFDNEEYFEDALNCVWSLINYRSIGGELM